jgi:hypothetical protein
VACLVGRRLAQVVASLVPPRSRIVSPHPSGALGPAFGLPGTRAALGSEAVEHRDPLLSGLLRRRALRSSLSPDPFEARLVTGPGRFQGRLELLSLATSLRPASLLTLPLALLFLATGERILAALFVALPLPFHLAL